MDSKQGHDEHELERRLFFGARVVAGLILFPVVTLIAAMLLTELLVVTKLMDSHLEGSLVFVTALGAVVGLATCAVVIWAPKTISQKIPNLARVKPPEPIASCLKFGSAGAILFGGPLLAAILILGHTRPIGWDFDKLPYLAGAGFIVVGVAGWRVGLEKKRGQG